MNDVNTIKYMDLMQKLNNDSKEYGMNSNKLANFYKIEEGNNNVLRVLTEPVAFAQYNYGPGTKPVVAYGLDNGDPRGRGFDEKETKSIRYSCYVLDRNTGNVLMATLPYSIMLGIAQLQGGDYKFSSFPMPFDLRIGYDSKAAPAQKYNVQPTRNEQPLTVEEENRYLELMKVQTPEQFVQKMKDNQKTADQTAGIWISPEAAAKMQEQFNEKANSAIQAQSKDSEPVVKYPEPEEEGLDPSAIPF